MTLRPAAFAAALAWIALPAQAAVTVTRSFNFSASNVIPDNNLVGIAQSRQVVTAITEITSLQVLFETAGGWNGDLYAYLSHGSGFSVLLNRPGRSLAVPDGSESSGMRVLFDDTAAADFHLAIPSFGFATGTYQPDGRNVAPAASLDSSPRDAFLSSFQGLDPNGEWTLFVADTSAGEVATLTRWSLVITGVPEPSVLLLSSLGTGFLLRRRRNATAPASAASPASPKP